VSNYKCYEKDSIAVDVAGGIVKSHRLRHLDLFFVENKRARTLLEDIKPNNSLVSVKLKSYEKTDDDKIMNLIGNMLLEDI
jgi:hypothetical protein